MGVSRHDSHNADVINIVRSHSIERTSPKGQPFVGTCWQCGRTGLTTADMIEPCENIAALSETESLIMAIDGPTSETPPEATK